MKQLLPPLVASCFLVALAAATRKISEALKQSLDAQFVPALGAVLGVVGLGVLIAALLRVRSNRLRRYSLVALGLAMVATPVWLSERGTAEQAAVEQMHFLFYGVLTLLYYRSYRSSGFGRAAPWLALLSATLVGILDESFQWLLALRTGEVFDILLNAYAASCGVVVSLGLLPLSGAPRSRRARPLWNALAVVLVLGLAAFVDIAHLGQWVTDRDVGSFRSYFRGGELLELNRDRDRRWQVEPPKRPYGWLDFQDYFETEAGEHVRLRNIALSSGKLEVAGFEQRILSRYYPAFLSLGARYPGKGLSFELAPWDLERVLAASAQVSTPYRSAADGGRIWTTSRALLWTVTLGVCLALTLGSWRLSVREAS